MRHLMPHRISAVSAPDARSRLCQIADSVAKFPQAVADFINWGRRLRRRGGRCSRGSGAWHCSDRLRLKRRRIGRCLRHRDHKLRHRRRWDLVHHRLRIVLRRHRLRPERHDRWCRCIVDLWRGDRRRRGKLQLQCRLRLRCNLHLWFDRPLRPGYPFFGARLNGRLLLDGSRRDVPNRGRRCRKSGLRLGWF